MTIEQLGSLGEFVGAIGVILSLLYVGMQLKQTNSMSRSSVRQTLNAKYNDWAMAVASSPDLAEAMGKVQFHDLVRKDANDKDRIHIAYAFVGVITLMHLAYEHWKEGILTQKEADELFGSSTALFIKPYLASLWPIISGSYPSDFSEWFARKYNLSDGFTDNTGT